MYINGVENAVVVLVVTKAKNDVPKGIVGVRYTFINDQYLGRVAFFNFAQKIFVLIEQVSVPLFVLVCHVRPVLAHNPETWTSGEFTLVGA